MWLSFASLDTLLLPLQVGHFGLLQHYHGVGTDERLRNHGEKLWLRTSALSFNLF